MSMTEEREMTDRERRDMHRFLEDLRVGVGPLNAAIAVGWSPAKLERMMKDPSFAELVNMAQEQLLESIEETLHKMAQGGHFKALQMVLLNKRPTVWRDIKHIQIEQTTSLDVGVVVSVKQAAIELLRERGVAALQPAVLDVESSERTD